MNAIPLNRALKGECIFRVVERRAKIREMSAKPSAFSCNFAEVYLSRLFASRSCTEPHVCPRRRYDLKYAEAAAVGAKADARGRVSAKLYVSNEDERCPPRREDVRHSLFVSTRRGEGPAAILVLQGRTEGDSH